MSVQVELVSPERIVWSGEAEMVIARTVGGGDIAFMDGHAPFVGALEVATATLSSEGRDEHIAVHGGFLEVTNEPVAASSSDGEGAADASLAAGAARATRTIVTILSDVAELGSEIDVSRAKQAQERATEQIRREGDSTEVDAEAALRRAHVRLAAANAI
jgi:F-type H+-transporting ATPase subunit epsilon